MKSVVAVLVALSLTSTALAQATEPQPQSADELVQALGQLPAAIPASLPGNGVLPPIERLRRDLYDRLWSVGPSAVPPLCHGLADPNVQVRRNVALFLVVAGGGWYDLKRSRLSFNSCMPTMLDALADPDSRVKELVANAVGDLGAAGAPAVPALIGLLGSPNEGERNTAIIGLTGIGPAARAALPALRIALSDSSANVRKFAQRAIERISN
jgi:HEAT repeat protein